MKHTFKKPSYYLISSAMDGNENAIEKLLAFYDPYISKCCMRPLYDEYGNVYNLVCTPCTPMLGAQKRKGPYPFGYGPFCVFLAVPGGGRGQVLPGPRQARIKSVTARS